MIFTVEHLQRKYPDTSSALDDERAAVYNEFSAWFQSSIQFKRDLQKRKIYLSRHLCQNLEEAISVIAAAIGNVYTDFAINDQKTELKREWPDIDGDIRDFIEKDCLQLLEDLQQEFRKLLGDDL
ncbi:MAG: hypothetical protein AAF708_13835 [Deinococcota bacterium]